MVSEIEVDDSETESHVSTGTFVSSPAKRSPTVSTPTKRSPTVSTPTKRSPTVSTPTNSKSLKKMIALFDYNPSANSPNKAPKDELSFHSGDIIYIHGNAHDDGFYSGELVNGKKGLVPSSYLKEISDENPIPKDKETNENKVS
jgi:hypothetical protein